MVGQASSVFRSRDGVLGVRHAGEREGADGLEIFRFAEFALINRRFVGEFFGGNVRDRLAVVLDDHAAGVGDEADFRPGQVPFVENALHLGFAALLDDDQHALLRFAEHDFVGRHVRRALRHLARGRSRCRCRRGRRFRRSNRSGPPRPCPGCRRRRRWRAIRGRPRSTSFSMNGSPTCTAPRCWSADSSVRSCEANAAPARPSRPVAGPT